MAPAQEIVATGRRKTSVARVRMTAGSGKIDINGRSTLPVAEPVVRRARHAWQFPALSCKLILICGPLSKPMACSDAIRA